MVLEQIANLSRLITVLSSNLSLSARPEKAENSRQ